VAARTVFIRGDIRLETPLVYEDQAKNVVVLGNLTSDFDISFKVKNLIVFGEIFSARNVFVNTAADFFISGLIGGCSVFVMTAGYSYYDFNDLVIEKLRVLGIHFTRQSHEALRIQSYQRL
jgi:hypothetical protein